MNNLILLDTLQTVFISIVSIIVGIALILAISIPLFRQIKKAKFKEYDYLLINDIVQGRDYYLLNNYTFKINEERTETINHIIGGNKYLYAITTIYLGKCKLSGDESDSKLIRKDSETQEKKYVAHPIHEQKLLLSKFCNIVGIDPSFLIGITLVNDECEVNYTSKSKQFYLIEKRKLKKLIQAIESRNVGNLSEKTLDDIFETLSKAKVK